MCYYLLDDCRVAAKLQLTYVFPSDGVHYVAAVTSLDGRLFVLFYPEDEQITIYDSTTFKLLQTLAVVGLNNSTHNGIIGCGTNSCLYISDYDKDFLYKVKLSDGNEVSKWSVDGRPRGLSVNTEFHLLVACHAVNKIQEFTTDGLLIREIRLQSNGVNSPWHALQLSEDQFLMSHGKPPKDVIVVDGQGRITTSYASKLESATRPKRRWRWSPTDLALDAKNNFLIVADHDNDRIVILNRLSNQTSMYDDGLDKPWTIHLDETREGRSRLYVGELYSGRILVFDIRYN